MSVIPATPTVDLAPLRSETLCASGNILIFDPDDQQYLIIPATCKSWACPDCAPRKQTLWAAKLRAGRPWLAITLTAKYEPWKTTITEARKQKRAFHKLVGRIRRRFGFFEYAAVWELQNNGMPHVHLLARAPYIPYKWLSATWHKLTGAWSVDIHRIGSLDYEADHSTKTLATYRAIKTYTPEHLVGKQTQQTAAALRPMRIIVLSRNYLKWGLPTDEPDRERPLVCAYTQHNLDRLVPLVCDAVCGIPRLDPRGHMVTVTPFPGIHLPAPSEILTGRVIRGP